MYGYSRVMFVFQTVLSTVRNEKKKIMYIFLEFFFLPPSPLSSRSLVEVFTPKRVTCIFRLYAFLHIIIIIIAYKRAVFNGAVPCTYVRVKLFITI